MLKVKYDSASSSVKESAKREGEMMTQLNMLTESLDVMRRSSMESVERIMVSSLKTG